MTSLRRVLLWLLPARVAVAVVADLDRELASGRERRPLVSLWYAWEGAKLVVHLWLAAVLDELKSERGLMVAGFGAIVVIATGAATASSLLYTGVLPPEGVLIVGLESPRLARDTAERAPIGELLALRSEMSSVVELSAFRNASLPLDRPSQPVRVAEMTASGFRALGVSPFLGRHLVERDERDDAPPVVVIGYDVWRSRFDRDRSVVGERIRVGDDLYTVVGVMPHGFDFPLGHQYWVPLRSRAGTSPAAEPDVVVFGRLAPGATVDAVQAELTMRAPHVRASRAHLLPYAAPPPDSLSPGLWELALIQFMASMSLWMR
jgi:hypothetical protein